MMKPGYHYCDGINSRGHPCLVTVPKDVRFCHHHKDEWYARKAEKEKSAP